MESYREAADRLAEFIHASPSAFHVIRNVADALQKEGFSELDEGSCWELKRGGKYFVIRGDSSVIAIKIPEENPAGFNIIAAHSDSPSFKIKENPEMERAGQYVGLNVEGYGGMLCGPWFDRPLSAAGRVAAREADSVRSILVDINRDLLMLPSLAVHMDRNANANVPCKIQSDMIPVFGDAASSGSFMKLVAEAAGTEPENILGHDLYLYCRTAPCVWGASEEYFSAPRLDDLQCAFSALNAVISSENKSKILLGCIFDGEEAGSRTSNGADSTFLEDTVARVCEALGKTGSQKLELIAGSYMLSADNAHAVHPNRPEKADPVNRPSLNGGVVLKFNANQKYTTNAISAAIFRQICENAGIPTQVYVNNSDIPGGSTLGNISLSHVSVTCCDIGCPQLAMHSPYETTGIRDTEYMTEAMKAFFSSSIKKTASDSYIIK